VLEDLVFATLESSELSDVSAYGLEIIEERWFISDLIAALDNVLNEALASAREFGWDGDHELWRLGSVFYVGYKRTGEDSTGARDVDEFHSGISPLVKLLHASVLRLAELNPSIAASTVEFWRRSVDPVHLRLWCSLKAAGVPLAQGDSAFLVALSDRAFWDVHSFPEVAEFRATRFSELSGSGRLVIEKRLMRGAPKSLWRRSTLTPAELGHAQTYWAVREFKRIELGGGVLSPRAGRWYGERVRDFDDVARMTSLDEGFLTSGVVRFEGPQSGFVFDIHANDILATLARALNSERLSWNDDPPEAARLWISVPENTSLLVRILLNFQSIGKPYWAVWNVLGWTHKPKDGQVDHREGEDVLDLLLRSEDGLLEQSLDASTHWVAEWASELGANPHYEAVWLRLLNTASRIQVVADDESSEPSISENSIDIPAFNSPVGRLTGAFIAICGDEGEAPFVRSEMLNRMRNSLVSLDGRQGQIAKLRLISDLSYFLATDAQWSLENLIPLLQGSDKSALLLWTAVGRRAADARIVQNISKDMLRRTLDSDLDRGTRISLGSGVIWEHLRSSLWNLSFSAPRALLQQVIRAADPEVRAGLADSVGRFFSLVARNPAKLELPANDVAFRRSVGRFLQEMWPLESALSTPGVSSAFAKLPALAGEAMSEAVNAIHPYIVAFNCWSLGDFGFWTVDGNESPLLRIDTPAKVEAILKLLDASIGDSEASVVPYDLAKALAHFSSVDANIEKTGVFRRLAALARN
jgi:hypothetical protein